MPNLKPILHKLLFHLTPKGRLNWDPTGKVGSSPPTPSDCQQSLWHPNTPRHFLCAAGAAVDPGRAGSPAVPGQPGLEVGAASGTLLHGWDVGLSKAPRPRHAPVPWLHVAGSVTGVGWVHQPTLSLQSVLGHAAPSPSKHNKVEEK